MAYQTVEQAREQAFAAMQSQTGEEILNFLNQALNDYPHDGTLLFLQASELAQQQHYDQALEQFSNAIFHEPNLHIARFQLALLASTMERGDLVEQHLPYLMELRESHYLGYFANALAAIFANELDNAIQMLTAGIANNNENPALNYDMQQMLDRVTTARNESIQSAPVTEENTETEEELEARSTLTGSVLLDIYKNTH